MPRRRLLTTLLLATAWLTGVGLVGAPLLASDCAALAKLQLHDVEITAATELDKPVPHCKVDGTISSSVGFSVWLPEDWNGRFAMGGQGGFAGSIDNQAESFGRVLEKGYATAATDTGHQAGAIDGSWALNDLQAILDYAHVAVHRVTGVAKDMTSAYYGKGLETSYFLGCSNGGREALQEAQRYPDDFDVILAGAPALDFDGTAAAFLYIDQRMYPDQDDLSSPVLSKAHRDLLWKAILARCDAGDGVQDGLVSDPPSCDFDPKTLACASGQADDDCLSPAELDALSAIYDGPRSASGEPMHVGYGIGAEDVDGNGWGTWLVGRANGAGPGVPSAAYGFGTGYARYFLYDDPDWSYEGYDFSTFEKDSKALHKALNAEDPDLDAFRAHGGKLLLFHGWADSALSPYMTIDYVRSVYERDPSATEDVRLFLMPGLLHCFGGNGPMVVDWLGAMEQWQASGKAPSELTAGFATGGGARKLCAWPKKAVYTSGDDRSPEAFECK